VTADSPSTVSLVATFTEVTADGPLTITDAMTAPADDCDVDVDAVSDAELHAAVVDRPVFDEAR
jgi:hypothetical protein